LIFLVEVKSLQPEMIAGFFSSSSVPVRKLKHHTYISQNAQFLR